MAGWSGRFTREQFTREGEIGFGAARFHVVENAGKTMARRFARAGRCAG